MNKIFKVIWSKTKHCWIVVSEIAKRHSKTKNSVLVARKIAMLALSIMLLLRGGINPVYAEFTATQGNWFQNLLGYNNIESSGTVVSNGIVAGYNNQLLPPASSAQWYLYNGDQYQYSSEGKWGFLFGIYNTSRGDLSFSAGGYNHIGSATFAGTALGLRNVVGSYLYNGEEVYVHWNHANLTTEELNAGIRGHLAGKYRVYRKSDDTEIAVLDDLNSLTSIWSRTQGEGNLQFTWGYGTSASGRQSTAFGAETVATGADALAFGYFTRAHGDQSTAWGHHSIARGTVSTAFGYYSKALGDYSLAALGGTTGENARGSIAMGLNSSVSSARSIALGLNSQVTGDGANNSIGIAIGKDLTVSGQNSIAIGVGHTVSGNNSGAFGDPNVITGNNSYAFGNNNTVSANNGFAIGNSTEVTKDGGVALGLNSKATVASGVAGYDPLTQKASTATNTTYKSNQGAVAVGDGTTTTRQITGLAAGWNDTDAVNVAQLKDAVTSAVNQAEENDTDTTYTAGNHISITGTDNKINVLNDGSVASGNTGIVTGGQVYNAIADVANSPLTFKGEAGQTAKKLGETLEVVGDGENITTKVENDKLVVSMDLDLDLDKLVIHGKNGKDGISVQGSDGKDGVTIWAEDGKDGSEGHIGLTGPAGADGKNAYADIYVKEGSPGVDGTDGITRIMYTDEDGTDHEVATLDDGMVFMGDSGTKVAKKLNEQLDITGGATGTLTDNNIGVVADGNALTVKLAKDIDLGTTGSVKFGTTGPSLSKDGLDMAGAKISGVADGTLANDAVNYSQLQALANQIGGQVSNLGELKTAGNQGTGSVDLASQTLGVKGSDSNITVTASGSDLTIQLAKDIDLGTNGSLTAGSVSIGKDGIDAGGKKITNVGDGEISSTSTDAITGKQVAPLFSSDGSLKGLTFQGNDGVNTTTKQLGDTLGIVGGATGDDGSFSTANIRTKVADGNIQISLAKNLTDINSLTTNGGVKIDGNGIDAADKKIANVADGTAAGDAVNYGQLQNAVSGLTGAVDDVTLNAYGDTGHGASVNLKNGALNVVGGATSGLTDNNIGVAAAGDTLTIKLAKDIDLGRNGSLTAGPVSIGKDGIDAGGKKITNVGDGEISSTSTDAITGKQIAPLFGSDGSLKGLTFQGNDGVNTTTKQLGDTLGIVGGATGDDGSFSTANIRTKVADGNIQISLAKNLTDINSLTTNGGVKIDGNGIDAADKKITNVADGTAAGDAVNYGQLQNAVSGLTGAVDDVTLNAYGDTGHGASVNLKNGALNVVGGATSDLTDNNIGVAAAGDTLTVKLAKDIDLTKEGSLSFGETGPSISKDGIDGGAQKIVNIKPGTQDGDAVSYEQVKDLLGSDGTALNSLTFAGETGTVEKKLGETLEVVGDGNITTKVENGQLVLEIGDLDLPSAVFGKDGANGKDGVYIGDGAVQGRDGRNGKDGISVRGTDGKDGVTLWAEDGANGTDGHIGLTGPAGADGEKVYADIYVKEGAPGVNGTDGITRIMYKDEDGTNHEVATLDDGLKFMGDTGTPVAKKLNEQLDITGGVTDAALLTDNNIGVVASDSGLVVKLTKDVVLGTNGSVTIGDTVVNNEGLTITGGPSVTKDGIDGGGNQITNVDAGTKAGDVVTYEQIESLLGPNGTALNSLTFAGETGDPVEKKLGEQLEIVGDGTNITTKTENGKLVVEMSNELDLESLVIHGKDGTNGLDGVFIGKDGVQGRDGADGKDGIGIRGTDGVDGVSFWADNGQDGKDGTEGHIGLTGRPGADGKNAYADISVKDGSPGLNGTDGMTRIVYQDEDGTDHEVATLDDGLMFAGESGDPIAKKLNEQLEIVGDGTNITTKTENGKLVVEMSNELDLESLVIHGKDGTNGLDGVFIGKDGVQGRDGADGKDGIGIRGTDGVDGVSFWADNGKDGKDGTEGHIGLTGRPGADGKNAYADISVKDGSPGLNGTDGMTRIVYQDEDGTDHEVATLDDGLMFGGDTGTPVAKKLNEQLDITGGVTDAAALTDNNIGVVASDNGLSLKLAKDIDLGADGSVTIGDTVVNNDGLTIVNGPSVTKNGIDGGGNKITNVTAGTQAGDVVTYEQIESLLGPNGTALNSLTFAGETGDPVEKKLGEQLEIVGDGQNITTKTENGKLVVEMSNELDLESLVIHGKDGTNGKDGVFIGKDGVQGRDGADGKDGIGIRGTDGVDGVSFWADNGQDGKDGTEGHIGLTGRPGADGKNAYADISVKDGSPGLNGTDGMTRIVYQDEDGTDHEIATLDDGLLFGGDTGTPVAKKLNEQLDITGGATGALTDNNIGVVASDSGLSVKLAQDITGLNSVETRNLTVTEKLTAKEIGADTVTVKERLQIGSDANPVTIDENGMDMGGKTISNVAPGTQSNDVATVGQVAALQNASNNYLNDKINRLDNKTRKGLAGAAALAALHPMDFDPDDKLTFAAGFGNYGGQNAAAVGAFYRPDDKTMFSVGGAMGNGENMVNVGVSFSLDRSSRHRPTTSKVAMAKEIVELKQQMMQMQQILNSRGLMLNPNLATDFPDNEQNHWAYEYVRTLAGNGVIEGYPDGYFDGERNMSRYEFAAMLYRAMMNGANLDPRAAQEFAPELGRIRVDRIGGTDNERGKVERVRVNNADKNTRDMYGTEIDPSLVEQEKAALLQAKEAEKARAAQLKQAEKARKERAQAQARAQREAQKQAANAGRPSPFR